MNTILKGGDRNIIDINLEVIKRQDEAAKNPDHPINDGLKKYFEERKAKLEVLKNAKKR